MNITLYLAIIIMTVCISFIQEGKRVTCTRLVNASIAKSNFKSEMTFCVFYLFLIIQPYSNSHQYNPFVWVMVSPWFSWKYVQWGAEARHCAIAIIFIFLFVLIKCCLHGPKLLDRGLIEVRYRIPLFNFEIWSFRFQRSLPTNSLLQESVYSSYF